jgi:tripartite-type tricarboxylate transporter receptor subunit TctC
MDKRMKQILSIFAGLLLATSALAFQPANTVKVIVPFPPGGGVDITFRKIERYAQQQGINMIPEYQPGAEGVVGMNSAMTAHKDGNTLIVTTTEVAASKDSTAKRFNSLTDFEYITGIRSSIFYLVSNNTDKNVFGFNAPTQKELIQQYIEEQKIKDALLVPYKSSGQMTTDLLNGTISKIIVPGIIINQQVDAGKVLLIKRIPNPGEFIVITPSGIPSEAKRYWDNFFKGYLTSEQAKKDAEADLTILRTFNSERVKNIVAKQL